MFTDLIAYKINKGQLHTTKYNSMVLTNFTRYCEGFD